MPPAERLTVQLGGDEAVGELTGDARPTILLLHGLASDRRELEPLAEAIAQAGMSALAIDLRGHGESQGPRGVVSQGRMLADVAAWRQLLAGQGHAMVGVAGHSLGGLWALAVANRFPVDALACLCSPASIRSELNLFELAGYRVAGAVNRVTGLAGKQLSVPYTIGPEDVLDDPEAIQRASKMELIQPSIPLANVGALLSIDGEAWARSLSCPALVIRASNDRVVDQAGPKRLVDALGGEVTFQELEGPHSLFLDAQGKQAAGTVAAWFADALASDTP